MQTPFYVWRTPLKRLIMRPHGTDESDSFISFAVFVRELACIRENFINQPMLDIDPPGNERTYRKMSIRFRCSSLIRMVESFSEKHDANTDRMKAYEKTFS